MEILWRNNLACCFVYHQDREDSVTRPRAKRLVPIVTCLFLLPLISARVALTQKTNVGIQASCSSSRERGAVGFRMEINNFPLYEARYLTRDGGTIRHCHCLHSSLYHENRFDALSHNLFSDRTKQHLLDIASTVRSQEDQGDLLILFFHLQYLSKRNSHTNVTFHL